MLTTTKDLYKLNKIISKCIHQIPVFYFFIIGMLCIVVLSLTSLSLFKDLTNLNTFIGVVYFVVFFDIIAIIARFTNRAFIEPYQLDIFPISKWRKFLFHFTILLLDYKSLIYLSAKIGRAHV